MPGQRRTRTLMLTVLSLVAWSGFALAEGVGRVTIWENLPAPWKWETAKTEPDDAFEALTLGFPQIPARVNDRGIEIDRSIPFALHAETELNVAKGPHRLILRSRGSARLLIDGVVLAETKPLNNHASGHEDVPDVILPEDLRWRYVGPGDQETIVPWESDGKAHRVELWAVIGEKRTRLETGELSASVVAPGEVPVLIGGAEPAPLTDEGWTAFAKTERARIDALDAARRRHAAASADPYWQSRHDLARRKVEQTPPHRPGQGNLIDRHIETFLKSKDAELSPAIDDAGFLRRLTLDTIGFVPVSGEVEAFLADSSPEKRTLAIDKRLADPRWADAWMGYWQDVLAENPGILKPTLNNTGPFRRYLHQAFADNTPFDRFVTDLIAMEGSVSYGGPAGFGVASQNDAPMAAKAHVLAKAFLAADMKCARCHDAPFQPFEQGDLFSMAALLDGKAQKIPATSTVHRQEGGRIPAVSVSLEAGDVIQPAWNLTDIGPNALPEGLLPEGAGPRDRLAGLITSPGNTRFARVIVNRLFYRYIGIGLVEPVDDWDSGPETRLADLLDDLAREFVVHDYDLKHIARLILNSRLYQGTVRPDAPLFSAPARRRMSAEQLVDSLFEASGKEFHAEELNLDPEGRRPASEFLNLGVPEHAWQFTSTSNERDRPALSLPVVQSVVDVLQTFGWRPSRQDPITVRDDATTPLQPAMLANGVVANRVAGLSDDSAITALCLIDQDPDALVRSVYLRILSRTPTDSETQRLVAYLGDTFPDRIVPNAKPNPSHRQLRRVSWSNHLNPEATTIQLESEKAARAGDPSTNRLTPEFRERMEDVVWALINSPEFLFIP